MSAPSKTSELDQVIQRLRRAASDLESAAWSASNAVSGVEEALDGMPDRVGNEGDLVRLVGVMHDAEHAGPQRYCSRDACRLAWEVTVS